jgi:hypothetical protein
MLNYIILSKQASIFIFSNPLKAIYSRFKAKTSKNALYYLLEPLHFIRDNKSHRNKLEIKSKEFLK